MSEMENARKALCDIASPSKVTKRERANYSLARYNGFAKISSKKLSWLADPYQKRCVNSSNY
jgi:hypothetical protein